MTSAAVGAQCTWATSASSPRWLRSIPMTGVMPLPAVRKRTFAGAGLGRVKSPVAWSSMTRVPARGLADQVGRDLAVGDRLGRDGDAPRRDAGRGRAVGAVGEAVGAPVAHAVDVDADPDVLPGHVAEPAAAGPDDDGHGIRGLGTDLDDAAAQVGAGPQRVDEVEVVARARAGWPGPRPPGGRRARRPRGGRGRGRRGGRAASAVPWRSVDRWCAHVRKRNLRERNLRKRNPAGSQPAPTFPPHAGTFTFAPTSFPLRS